MSTRALYQPPRSAAEVELARIRAARTILAEAEAALEAAKRTEGQARKAFNTAVVELRKVLDDQAALPFGGES